MSARRLRGLVVPLGLLGIWYAITAAKLVNPLLVAAPARVITRALLELREGDLLTQLAASLARDLLGFAAGSVLGLSIGGLMGLSRTVDRLLGPSLHAAKQVAIFAWLPLISMWFGAGESAKLVFIAFAAFYPVALNTYEGVAGVSREYLEVARVYRLSQLQIVRRVVLPAAAASIFVGLQLALVYAWLGTLGAEFLLAAAPGVGNLMIDGRESFQMDKVLLGVIIAGAVGASLNGLAGKLEARTLRWRARGL